MKKMILIIEDNRLNYKLLADFLGAQGYATQNLDNGRDVISFVQKNNTSLILLDIQLPDISGFDVMDLLKNDPVARCIPVIAVTACAHAEEQHLAKIKGFQAYVTKPVQMNEMLTLIQGYIP